MRSPKRVVQATIFGAAFTLAVLGALSLASSASAQTALPDKVPAQAGPDPLQRSYRIDHYLEAAASGPARGENIYFHKCWVCHNQFQESAPKLTGLFEHPELLSGAAVNDQSVADKITHGGPGMPSFGTTISKSDIADLISYLRESRCCFEGDNPPVNTDYQAARHKWPVPTKLTGGVHGNVRTPDGASVEGVMVQLIAPNAVRTTVYSNSEGKFEFPLMQAGTYTLRLPSPVEFAPLTREGVHVEGAAGLDDIVLEKISDAAGALQATPEIESQLSGAELLWNLPGTAKEKDNFKRTCGASCHSYQQILRNRYDERSWRVLVARMLHHGGGPIINPPGQPVDARSLQEDDALANWLARVRGPGVIDAPLLPFPRPTGASTRAVITEYEVPHIFMTLHDVAGDSHGNIWYTTHFTKYVGKLDPRTGIVAEYATPPTVGALPGTHHVLVDKNGMVLFSENWSKKLAKFDPRTQKFSEVPIESASRVNSGGFGNFAMTPDGSIWVAEGSDAVKIDSETGKVVQKYPFAGRGSYESLVSPDGRYWAGGSPLNPSANTAEILDLHTGKMVNLNTGARQSSPRRGAFDTAGNAWYGGMNGTLVELDLKAQRLREFWPPTPLSPYTDFYTAVPDKNGEVWTGELHGKGYLRFNPRTNLWREYVLPEPYAHDRGGTWVDNSTNPVSVWYADYSLGRIVRIQPLD